MYRLRVRQIVDAGQSGIACLRRVGESRLDETFEQSFDAFVELCVKLGEVLYLEAMSQYERDVELGGHDIVFEDELPVFVNGSLRVRGINEPPTFDRL